MSVGYSIGVYADGYITRPEVQAYIGDLIREHQFDEARLTQLFREVKKQNRVLQIIEKPAESKPWYLYRRHFVNSNYIDRGVLFWLRHQALLRKIEKQHQIPTEIILAIIGIETIYGENTGRFPVIDTLVTLSFDYPRRSKFFRKELTDMLLLVREEGYSNYRSFKSSYAGAMGIGQFIPSSYRRYAVDFDGDGHRDLWGSIPDAVASVANYLARHGWQPDQPVANVVHFTEQKKVLRDQLNARLRPHLGMAEAADLGIIDPQSSISNQFALFSLEIGKGHYQYWAGYQNFYTITRYNHSRRYAMAVYLLSQAIKEKYLARVGER